MSNKNKNKKSNQLLSYLKKNLLLVINGVLIFIIWIDLWYLLSNSIKFLDKKIGKYAHIIILSVCMLLLFMQNYDFQFIEDSGL